MTCYQKFQSLIEQGRSYLGMINEAHSKCLLLEQKVHFFNKKSEDSEDNFMYVSGQLNQIRDDINTYSEQLFLIREELRSYGAFAGLE